MKHLRRSRQRGIALVWVALVGIILILFVAVAGDTAYVYLTGHQLQNAADAAALAGAWEVRDDQTSNIAQQRAHDVALQNIAGHNGGAAAVAVQLALNPGNAAGGDIVIGVFDSGTQTFTPTLTSPNAVKVLARRTNGSPAGPLPLIFGPMAGVNNSNVSRTAIAVVGGPSVGAGLILLNRHDPSSVALTGTGNNVKINIPNGAIQINSDADRALSWSGSPTIVASALYIGGTEPDAKNVLSGGTLGINSPPVADPLAALPPPPQGQDQSSNNSTTLHPGFYPNGFPKNKQITLETGVYYIRGDINTNKDIDAAPPGGVLLFFENGGINMGGNAELKIKPMATGPYAGISIYMARGNASDVTLRGTQSTNNTGTFYMPSAHVSIQGNPNSAASQMIADTLTVQGNGQLNISYNGSFPIQGHKIWLAQ